MAETQLTAESTRAPLSLSHILPDVYEQSPSSVLLHGQALHLRSYLARSCRVQLIDDASSSAGSPSMPDADLLVSHDALSKIPPERLGTVLAALARRATHAVIVVDTAPTDADTPHRTIRSCDWWKCKLEEHFGKLHVRSPLSARFAIFRTWPERGPIGTWRSWQRLMRRGSSDARPSAEPATTRDSATPDADAITTCPACVTGGATFVGQKVGFDFWRCTDCGLVFTDPMPTDAELVEFYRSHPRNSKYARKADGKLRRAGRRISRLRRQVSGKRFLDIGCSIGSAVEAARLKGFDATGIDLDAESVRQALQLFPHNRFLQGTPNEFAELGEQFDLIFCTEVIEHVPQPDRFMQAVRRLLAPGGLLYVTTPHLHHFRVPRNVLDWHSLKPPEHIAMFGRKALKTLMERHRLKTEHIAWDIKPNLKATFRAVD
ncbi:Ubiquinone biosynthesis O-methyltransferase [Maioricimonas rarisocia]|uniref:Ubiquinone biosynthesis O-methyltransferase n=1 Tax=Maioricimonas rarisocia TaxID=2528026 RepID=A0A517Z454_9PLAN|nr:class I SAM-dependent methyltransferase [Maioricimonas rarisocia]QDU37256.1 Ubiquinone biosynthesis O-methyltransferase [Maioricimonas rarisocia]